VGDQVETVKGCDVAEVFGEALGLDDGWHFVSSLGSADHRSMESNYDPSTRSLF